MIEVLQKVTTFPLELIQFPSIDTIYTDQNEIHKYYSEQIKLTEHVNFGTVSEKLLNELYISPTSGPSKTPNEIEEIKKRFITYNSIYDKLFANNLNVLEKTDEPTLIIFPTHDQQDKGRVQLNPKVSRYYYDKFEKIKKTIDFKDNENVCYYSLNVFSNEQKDEYKKYIKTQFDDIKKMISEYNASIKQVQYKVNIPKIKIIKNILFLIDTDKKSLFTGLYKNQLSKEKQDILNKEYSSFLSSAEYRSRKVDDSSINLTFNNVLNEVKRFKQRTNISIDSKFLKNQQFDNFINTLKELYKKITDKQYKEALDLKDNIKEVKFFYKIENADKVLEDKILTGSNKLYYLFKDPENKKHVIGYFILMSEERGIYRFKEDASHFKKRNSHSQPSQTNISNPTNEMKANEPDHENDVETLPDGAYDFAVEIKNNFGVFKYKNLDTKSDYKNVERGFITPYLDKTEGTFKWFNFRDIDASLLNKEKIKYYSDILFDKKTLIEYLKSKKKYSDKTVLSYEFLKINDSQELSEYCDFIHKNYKSNIINTSGFDLFNPFKIKFDDNTIIKNIRDIIFETNTPIYLRENKETKEEQRTASRDSYKIVKYKLFDDFDNDESCKIKEDIYDKGDKGKRNEKPKLNKCFLEYNGLNSQGNPDPNKKYNGKKESFMLIVTKTNIKDSDLLKSKTDCKTKKNKLVYNYKKLFSNATRRLGFAYLGGTMKRKNKLRNRCLKTKCYK